jgi:hypothetical protein
MESAGRGVNNRTCPPERHREGTRFIKDNMTEQTLRTKGAAIDLKSAQDRKVIADAQVTIAQAQARLAAQEIEKTEVYLEFIAAQEKGKE